MRTTIPRTWRWSARRTSGARPKTCCWSSGRRSGCWRRASADVPLQIRAGAHTDVSKSKRVRAQYET
jgi:hypothetical protein